jgi:hypothetical protein
MPNRSMAAWFTLDVSGVLRMRGVTRKTFAQTEFSGESAKVILRLEPLQCG